MNNREIVKDAGFDESIAIDDMDDAIIGVSTDGNVIYDYNTMLAIRMQEDDISEADAREDIEFNIIAALPYYDPAPIVIYRLEDL